MIGQINGKRKGLLLRFLDDSDLIGSSEYPGLKRRSSQVFDREIVVLRLNCVDPVTTSPVVSLEGADLRDAGNCTWLART